MTTGNKTTWARPLLVAVRELEQVLGICEAGGTPITKGCTYGSDTSKKNKSDETCVSGGLASPTCATGSSVS